MPPGTTVLGARAASTIVVAMNWACGLNRFPACTVAPVMTKSSTPVDIPLAVVVMRVIVPVPLQLTVYVPVFKTVTIVLAPVVDPVVAGSLTTAVRVKLPFPSIYSDASAIAKLEP